MTYIDVFMAAVPKQNKDAYHAHARQAAQIFCKHGALQVSENWEDEITDGEVTSMPKAVQRRDDEAVVIGWVIWPSKSARDKGMPQAMQDMRSTPDLHDMPFDGKRLIYGGFSNIFTQQSDKD